MGMGGGWGGAKGSQGAKGGGAKGKGGKGGGGKPQGTGKSYTGTVKSFNETNNYGFIDCPEVKAEYGFDVFTHGKELQGHPVGSAVYFELGLSNKGQPQALNVSSAMGGMGDMGGMGAMGGMGEMGGMSG